MKPFIFGWLLFFICVSLWFCSALAQLGSPTCNFEGHLQEQKDWYGFLAEVEFSGEKDQFLYDLSFPANYSGQNLLMYYEDQVPQLKDGMTCQDKMNILSPEDNQIIYLDPSSFWSGCKQEETTGMIRCNGNRSFKSVRPRQWFIAVARCSNSSSRGALDLKYHLQMYGNVKCHLGLGVGAIVGIVLGVLIIVSIPVAIVVFLLLWKRSKK